jgi:hypothetical protein
LEENGVLQMVTHRTFSLPFGRIRTGRRNRLARDRWQALEQALADFAAAALVFEQD